MIKTLIKLLKLDFILGYIENGIFPEKLLDEEE